MDMGSKCWKFKCLFLLARFNHNPSDRSRRNQEKRALQSRIIAEDSFKIWKHKEIYSQTFLWLLDYFKSAGFTHFSWTGDWMILGLLRVPLAAFDIWCVFVIWFLGLWLYSQCFLQLLEKSYKEEEKIEETIFHSSSSSVCPLRNFHSWS